MTDITAIVPLDLRLRPKDILKKAVRMVIAAQASDFRIVFGLNDHGTRHEQLLKKSLAKLTSSQLISSRLSGDVVNISALRNLAFTAVETPYLALLDVDIWPDFALFEKYRDKIAQGKKPFYFLPCLYLTEKGSSRLIKQAEHTQSLTERYFSFSRKEFLHLASPSSITVMKAADYQALGGFNSDFTGHGYEDFDFMLRLASRYGEIQHAPDFLSQQAARSPLFATGFKRELGRLCIDTLLEKDFVYHIHHTKMPFSRFYSSRASNYEKFSALHSSFVGGEIREDPTLISEFLKRCCDIGKSISEYSILFENKPGHIDRYDTLRRRLRFLLND